MSKTIDIVVLGIFLLIIANSLLLCLFLLLTLVANYLIIFIINYKLSISLRQNLAVRQDIMDQVNAKAQDRQIVYNLSILTRTDFASIRIFIIIIVNFKLLLLFTLTTIFANLFNCVKIRQ